MKDEDLVAALYKVYLDLKNRPTIKTDTSIAVALVLTVASINVLCTDYNIENPLNNTRL